jgi:hypothetical protein
MTHSGVSWRAALLGGFAAVLLASCGPNEPATGGGPLEARRLTETQYRQTIADIFGEDIKIAGRFEPGIRKNGLLAVGTAVVAVSPSGFEQYDTMARSIAEQVVDEKHRGALIPCKPASPKAADPACAAQFLGKYGRMLFRRPLTGQELASPVDAANNAAKTLGDFYTGLEYGLARLLDSPKFLFREDVEEADPAHPGAMRLTGYSKAARLSFLLWNTGPDNDLIKAAETGDLDSKKGLSRQGDRLLASPRLEAGVRAFFSDFLGFDQFNELAKDPEIYPAFSSKVARDAQEQTLRTITDLLITRKGDYRDLFTTRKTFMTRPLGLVYRVKVTQKDGWQPFEFPADDPRMGILTQLSFTELHSHPGRSSATLRGKAVRELLLCEAVPMPPANVNFTVVQDTKNPVYKTGRERLTAHRTNPACAGCHKIMDPIGLALENFDGAGQYRSEENNAAIDTSGELDGVAYQDVAGLAKALRDNPATTSCLIGSVYRYAAGRDFDTGERAWQAWLAKGFVAGGYHLPDLLRQIATSDAFYAIRNTDEKNLTKEAQR